MGLFGGDPATRGLPVEAQHVPNGARVPVQTEGGGLEVRVVAGATTQDGFTYLQFEDGSAWAWEPTAPILLAPPPL